MEAAIGWCIEHKVLEEFLKTHSSEVRNMLFTKWNWDTALEVNWEEGREKGREEGIEAKQAEDIKKLLKHSMTVEQVAEVLELPVEAILQYL
jgi:predicted transposase/invertase (TIGR01784 family)